MTSRATVIALFGTLTGLIGGIALWVLGTIVDSERDQLRRIAKLETWRAVHEVTHDRPDVHGHGAESEP